MIKKFGIFICFLCIGQLVQSQNTNAIDSSDKLEIKEISYDFGSIPQGKPVFHFFEIFNSGNSPLLLNDVQASCGCTTPEWNHDTIPAGGSTKIKVGFNAAQASTFEKNISIKFNNYRYEKILVIKGNVWKTPEGHAPQNASIIFLKNQTL